MKILIADDDPQILRALRITLNARGYDIVTAEDGQAAISSAIDQHPDLVMLDLGMPRLDGLAVIDALRGWSSVPILVVSGRTGAADKVEALDRGADDYVTKPFSIDELLARIRETGHPNQGRSERTHPDDTHRMAHPRGPPPQPPCRPGRRPHRNGAPVTANSAGVLTVWFVLGAATALILRPSASFLGRYSDDAIRPAVFATRYSLSRACFIITYPLAEILACIEQLLTPDAKPGRRLWLSPGARWLFRRWWSPQSLP